MKMNNTIMVCSLSLTSLTLVAGGVLASSTASASDIVDKVNIAIPIICTISGTGMNSHNAEINNGNYTPNIGSTTLNVFCNDNEGFAIYAAGYTGNEIGGENSNKLVGSSASGNATIESGLATSAGNPDVSNWAMKLAITQDSGDTTGTNAFTIDSAPNVSLPSQAEQGATNASFSSYHVVPNEYIKVAHKNSSTDMTANTGGVNLTTTYAAYISKTQVADTYSGQVIYTLVHPSSADAPQVCNPNGTISQMEYMQDISSCNRTAVLNSMDEGVAYTLLDSRDQQQYHVAKLADGNIWMLDNLALDPTDPATATNMNESNTNATAEAINYYLHGGGSAAGWSNTAVIDMDTGWDYGNNDSWEQPWINNASKDTLVTSFGPASSNGQAKIGLYYNYCAASVGTKCNGTNPGDVPQDICPANWRIPTGGSNSEFSILAQEYSSDSTSTDSLQYNLSTPLSGYYSGNSATGQGSNGSWWGCSHDGSCSVLGLFINPTYVDSMHFSYGFTGHTIRCLAAD